MKIVVTGALGHIGSRLIRELPASIPDGEIIMVDNLSTQRYASLFDLPSRGKYRFIEADLLDVDLPPILKGADTVVHLAAITNAADSFAIRDKIERENLESTRRVAEACVQTGSALLFTSTTSVYGSQEERVDEDCSPENLEPQSPYAEAKLKEEALLHSLGESRGLPFIVCRFGTIFGISPGMRFHTAVNKFCWQAVMGLPVTVWRTAIHQKRPYLDLLDAVHAILFLIRNRIFDRRIYNVLTTNVTVNDIVEIIRKYVPELQIEFVDHRIMNQLSYTVLNQRFKDLGFEFRGDLAGGIKETVQLLKGSTSI